MDFANIKVYRITHIENIPHILRFGITHRNSPNKNLNYLAIGDVSLITTRDIKQVKVDNGDFLNFDAPMIRLGDYIPFYFGVRMPMLYVIQNGGNFVREATMPGKIIYLVCSLSIIVKNYENLIFSDGHATDNLTSFYDKSMLNKIPEIIDWEAVKAQYWSGNENLNIRRKKQAELLISNDIAPNHILGFGCYNEEAKQSLLGYGIKEDRIKIISGAYY